MKVEHIRIFFYDIIYLTKICEVFMNDVKSQKKDEYRTSRILYIIQAAVEYFIATLAGGAYLAKITSAVGIPDDVTAILTATVSLGVGFQLFALFISRNKRAK